MKELLLPNGMSVFHQNENETRFMYGEIFERGMYLKGKISLPPRACVIDVGANIGLLSLFAAARSPGARIYAFEPIPVIYRVLDANFERFEVDGVALNLAVGERQGRDQLHFYPESSLTSGRHASPEVVAEHTRRYVETSTPEFSDVSDLIVSRKIRHETLDCTIVTLERVLAELEEPIVDLLKIDVEGSELQVLDGIGPREAWERVRQVVLEVDEHDGTLRGASESLRARGFHVELGEDAAMRGTGLRYVYARRPEPGVDLA